MIDNFNFCLDSSSNRHFVIFSFKTEDREEVLDRIQAVVESLVRLYKIRLIEQSISSEESVLRVYYRKSRYIDVGNIIHETFYRPVYYNTELYLDKYDDENFELDNDDYFGD